MRGQASNEEKKKKPSKDGINQRSDGSWTFVVELPRNPKTGKRRQKRVTVRGLRKNAERKKRELQSQIDQEAFSWSPARMTLVEFLDYYLDIVKGKRENTYQNYVTSFKAFRRCLGDSLLLSDIKTDNVQRAVNELSSKLEKSSVKEYFTKLKTAFRYATNPGVKYLAYNPCDGVIVNKPDPKEKAVWDDNQCIQFIRFCQATTLRYVTMFALLLKSGARIGEVQALRWKDVDFEAGLIYITRTASGKGYNPPKSANGIRKVPLDQGTVRMLSKHKIRQSREKLLRGEGYNPEGLVFCESNGKRLSHQLALSSFACIVKRAGLPKITPHGLRHTHATMLLRNGHSVNAVAERLGDDPKTIMKTYAHVLPGMREAIVRTIEELYETYETQST